MSRINLTQQSTPSPPSANQVEIFFDQADQKLKQIVPSGTVTSLVSNKVCPNYYAESLGETSTTTIYSAWTNKVTLTQTPVAGDYMLWWSAMIANSSAASDVWIRVQNGTSVYMLAHYDFALAYSVDGWIQVCGFTKLTLTAVSRTFTMDFAPTGNTGYIKNAKLFLEGLT